ncbi:hypothetical protein RU10_23580 [Pseudomonas fluorescens]|uniref:Uncharacterized protein n=1 Tax=Pseudomonas fluorescens TaxID=294 RepID=A0AAE2DUK6_PSEFL|nr:hypothetical protein RU10_23580 [Pseudomonas fluorescens]
MIFHRTRWMVEQRARAAPRSAASVRQHVVVDAAHAKTCTTPDATTTQAVTLRGRVGYMTRPKGITVRITEMMKPTMYERLVPWLVPALL